MIFDQQSWDMIMKGFFVRDCTLGYEDGRLGFLLVEEAFDAQELEEGVRTRFISVRPWEPVATRFFSMSGRNLSFATVTCAWKPSQTEFVVVDSGRNVWSYKPKTYKGDESRIPFDGRGYGYGETDEIGCAIIKMVRVGTTIYALGTVFRIFERLENQKWMEVKDIPIPDAFKSKDPDKIIPAISDSDFWDMAAFSPSDMYAVGGAGTVWHRQGSQWRQRAFPTNLRLHTVVCAGDGNVYITDIRGSVWQGREDRWKLIVKADMNLPFVDSAWFDGRLWCANDYGAWVLENGKLVSAHAAKHKPMPVSAAIHAHRLDVSPDGRKMLVAGGHGASLYDGETWELLFDGSSFLGGIS